MTTQRGMRHRFHIGMVSIWCDGSWRQVRCVLDITCWRVYSTEQILVCAPGNSPEWKQSRVLEERILPHGACEEDLLCDVLQVVRNAAFNQTPAET